MHETFAREMLGHASASMTMDTCGHLFGNPLDEVAEALDLARERPREHAREQAREDDRARL